MSNSAFISVMSEVNVISKKVLLRIKVNPGYRSLDLLAYDEDGISLIELKIPPALQLKIKEALNSL